MGELTTKPLLPGRTGTLLAATFWLGTIVILLSWHRPPICPCGMVRFWAGEVQSAENSQQITDWYSFSHLIHGMLFYGVAHLLWRRAGLGRWLPARTWALPLAVLVEGSWELLENSPIIIDRYRAVTISYGYSGDSVLNSASDIACMVLGFLFAARVPARLTIAVALAFELFTLAMIRDNLTLNVLMLASPIEAVRQWQAAT
ncbi:DUF2585 domain-containing protein [Novosphingobium cyanobacteriorum]|uniref:UPF0314 protein POM99_12140 n=1 Tax=Novosphingobium cyanobacteriorum TaxID=3024215 RepID=A0ABT6CJ90_9SPHN|nr:DUF2585 domain-containing protein [Novosphingobium cyanobacteriorum]MDF8333956.1 DUF2585 domain-containing protein [Novosphingobium cyanobacteriorum]